jgi:hypothetical protein
LLAAFWLKNDSFYVLDDLKQNKKCVQLKLHFSFTVYKADNNSDVLRVFAVVDVLTAVSRNYLVK